MGLVSVPACAAAHVLREVKSTAEDHSNVALPPLLMLLAVPVGAAVEVPALVH
jgi:hypothetical protein